jgi:hypothetical protein
VKIMGSFLEYGPKSRTSLAVTGIWRKPQTISVAAKIGETSELSSAVNKKGRENKKLSSAAVGYGGKHIYSC